jgi:hypothetical protein
VPKRQTNQRGDRSPSLKPKGNEKATHHKSPISIKSHTDIGSAHVTVHSLHRDGLHLSMQVATPNCVHKKQKGGEEEPPWLHVSNLMQTPCPKQNKGKRESENVAKGEKSRQ